MFSPLFCQAFHSFPFFSLVWFVWFVYANFVLKGLRKQKKCAREKEVIMLVLVGFTTNMCSQCIIYRSQEFFCCWPEQMFPFPFPFLALYVHFRIGQRSIFDVISGLESRRQPGIQSNLSRFLPLSPLSLSFLTSSIWFLVIYNTCFKPHFIAPRIQ